jgi:transcriptional regulator with XRE-family HTH domain
MVEPMAAATATATATMPAVTRPHAPRVGDLLRDWRQRRRLSQLDLAGEADVSTRHLSCLETGRAEPSREMVLRLADRLDVPLRERNRWLAAAGFAPMFAERRFDDPGLAAGRAAVELILRGHEPFPAVAVDRHWNLVAANTPAFTLMADGVDQRLLEPPVNVMRIALHPDALGPRIVNFAQYAAHLVDRLRREADAYGDRDLADLADELCSYPGVAGSESPAATAAELFVPLALRVDDDVFTFFSTLATFGTARDITIEELAIESFFPADAATAAALRTYSSRS